MYILNTELPKGFNTKIGDILQETGNNLYSMNAKWIGTIEDCIEENWVKKVEQIKLTKYTNVYRGQINPLLNAGTLYDTLNKAKENIDVTRKELYIGTYPIEIMWIERDNDK